MAEKSPLLAPAAYARTEWQQQQPVQRCPAGRGIKKLAAIAAVVGLIYYGVPRG